LSLIASYVSAGITGIAKKTLLLKKKEKRKSDSIGHFVKNQTGKI